jgi:RNA-directed DNA polymerase
VQRNRGAPGIDQITLGHVEQYGVARLLGELAAELGEGRPLPTRRVFIPKPGTSEQRPLSIPAVRDRIVQAACKIVLEPIFEADFLSCSFGFRPKRAQHDGLRVLIDEAWRGRRWVVETDIANCFSAIPHEKLMQAVEERVCDQAVLKLLRAMLRSGVGCCCEWSTSWRISTDSSAAGPRISGTGTRLCASRRSGVTR